MDAVIAREAQRGQVAAVLRAALFYGDFGAALLNAGYVLDALVNHRTDGLEEFKATYWKFPIAYGEECWGSRGQRRRMSP